MSISIIIPVYNADKYLTACVDSILRQTYQDFEIILVDDGSKDTSGLICDNYVCQDKRIQVIHQDNGGVTSARREGVIQAKFEWIMFVDADDELETDGLENLVRAQEHDSDLDIVEGAYTWFYPDGTTKHRPNMAQEYGPVYFDSHSYSRSLYIKNGPARGPWAKLIRKQILVESGALDLPRRFTNREDAMMLTSAARLIRKAVLLPESVYLYRQQFGESAASNRLSFNYWSDYLEYTESVVLKGLLPQWNDVWYNTITDVFGIIVHSGCIKTGDIPHFFDCKVLPVLSCRASQLNKADRFYIWLLRQPALLRYPICGICSVLFSLKKVVFSNYFSIKSRR